MTDLRPAQTPLAPACLLCGTRGGGVRKGQSVPERCRGLCSSCRSKARRNGTLEDYPSRAVGRSADEVLEEWVLIQGPLLGRKVAAQRMGMTYKALDQVLVRALRRSDPRVGPRAVPGQGSSK